jgi:ATP-binding cassette subfamily B protein
VNATLAKYRAKRALRAARRGTSIAPWRAMRAPPKTSIAPHDLPALDSATFRRIVQCVKPYWLRALGVGVCMVAAAVLSLASPWLVKRVVDVALPNRDLRLLWLCCAGMIAGPLLAEFVRVGQKYAAETIGQDVMLDLRIALYRRFHLMPFASFTKLRPGEAVSHVLNDVQGVGDAVSGTLADVAQNTVIVLSATAFMIVLEWRLALVAVASMPLLILRTHRVGQTRKAIKRRAQARTSEFTGVVTETLSISGALLVRTFDSAEAEVTRFRRHAVELKRLALAQALVGRWFRMLLRAFESIGPAVVFALGGWWIVRGEIPLGTVVALAALMKRVYNPASDLASVHVDLMTSYAYFERVFAVLDRTEPRREGPAPVKLGSVVGRLELRNVSFAYDDDSAAALSAVNVTIPEGTTVGIVGSSGAGKTTLGALIMRLYDPTDGAVCLDGTDLRQLSLSSLRANIAVVTQETFLLHATVFENLRYGNPAASLAQIEDAARRAQIHDRITALPDGYHTMVGERGYRFSAGERQRLAIARAILKDPRILILDEATSALDSVSERLVQQALAPLLEGRTSVIITHRLSTIRDADLIVVLDRGTIVERGTHDELLARNGRYAWLWRAQARRAARPAVYSVPGAAAEAVAEPLVEADSREQVVGLV